MAFRFLDTCMLYPPEATAGLAFTVEALARAGTKAGHRFLIAARTTGDTASFKEQDGVTVMRVPVSLPMHSAAAQLQRAAAEFVPDFINCHLSSGYDGHAIGAAASAGNARIVYFLHFYKLICNSGTLFNRGNCGELCPRCRVISEANQPFTARASGVCSLSRHTLERHRAEGHFTDVPSLVAPSMVDVPPAPLIKETHEEPVFGFIGRIRRPKGIVPLLSAAARHDLKLLVAGTIDSPFVQQLRESFESSRIRFLGWQERNEFFRMIDICVVPSLYEEPFGRVSVEAQASGTPVLVSRMGGLTETFREGVTGWGYAPDTGGLEDALLRARDAAPLSGDDCHAFAATFTPDAVWPKYEAFFQGLSHAPSPIHR